MHWRGDDNTQESQCQYVGWLGAQTKGGSFAVDMCGSTGCVHKQRNHFLTRGYTCKCDLNIQPGSAVHTTYVL